MLGRSRAASSRSRWGPSNDEDQTCRKVKLICEDVQGYNCLTNFCGMGDGDKLAALIKKWQTLVENVDVKTTDGYTLDVRHRLHHQNAEPGQQDVLREQAQVRQIRKKMVIMPKGV